MSACHWDESLASANNLLTDNECCILLDESLFCTDQDILKSFPGAATKIETVNFQDDLTNSMYPPSPVDIKPSQSERAEDLLQQLESQCKQENIYSNWFEEKVENSIFDNISQAPEPEFRPVADYTAQTVPRSTEILLREFESVYSGVQLTHLTPPQSPPGPATQLLLSYAQAQAAPVLQPLPVEQWPIIPPQSSIPEYDCDPQALEELVRHRAAQLASPQPSHSPSTSPLSSPSSSPRSSSTDEDWTSSRPKPYSRNGDDRRSRKKEQNKNAATRYRQKKKAEIEVLLTEEQDLRKRHGELGDKCSDLQREIRYIKGILRDLFKAKGLIK